MVDSVGMSNRYIIPSANVSYVTPVNTDNTVFYSSRVTPAECQSCKNRRYQDDSDEMVSFKAPDRISPRESYTKVMSHEQEHVANAIAEGNEEDKELLSATVCLKTAICPECGRAYIAGGTTRTMTKTYGNDPYSQNLKAYEKEAATGNYIDYAA